jgi:hypothetical protein
LFGVLRDKKKKGKNNKSVCEAVEKSNHGTVN